MNTNDLLSKVKITRNGSICLGKSLVCDGFENEYKSAAFTHAHHDHVADGFERCMHQCAVYTSKITAELLEAITADTYMGRTQLHKLDYDSPQMLKRSCGDILTLKESKHMFGASLVFLVTHDKIKIVYSGDISPQDRPPECDILVVDSTRGTPNFDRIIDSHSLERRLVDAVVAAIDGGRPVCIHAHRGRLQSAMNTLSHCGDIVHSVPFLASPQDCSVANVYRKYGYNIRDLVDLNSYTAEEIIDDVYPWIEFRTNLNITPQESRHKVRRMVIAGGFGKTTITDDNHTYWMASDEHAEFTSILNYIDAANPQVVVTDNSRAPHGSTLAEEIQSQLGITAMPMPNLNER